MHHRVITLTIAGLLVAGLAPAGPARAQTPGISDSECQALRERLAGHAKLSEGVRRALASQVGAAPAPAGAPVAAAPAAPAPTSGEAIRARIAELTAERQALETQRLGAVMKFDLSQAAQVQAKIQALDTEKAKLEAQAASAPAAPPSTAPPAVPATATVDDASRVRCQDVRATLDNAVKIRQRELGAREGQAGVIPLVAVKAQWDEEIAKELAAQLPASPGTAPVGLLDADGDGKLDAVVDVPASGVYRVVRRRADGTLGVEAFALSGSTAAYGEATRRLDEATMRQTGQTLEGVLALRPAGQVRTIAETGDFTRTRSTMLGGNHAEAAKIEGPAAQTVEFQNLRGETVRVLEIITPVSSGFSVRRVAVLCPPNANETWDETTTVVRPVSAWRTDVEIVRAQETRTTAGAPVGARKASGPFKLTLER